jgi:hypothetical protein
MFCLVMQGAIGLAAETAKKRRAIWSPNGVIKPSVSVRTTAPGGWRVVSRGSAGNAGRRHHHARLDGNGDKPPKRQCLQTHGSHAKKLRLSRASHFSRITQGNIYKKICDLMF